MTRKQAKRVLGTRTTRRNGTKTKNAKTRKASVRSRVSAILAKERG